MNTKAIIRRCLDVLMSIGLLFSIGYQFWGQAAHEWIGAGMFLLFIAHHILNYKWYKNLFRGKYTAMRIFQLCINLLTLAAMLALMYSGIVMSRHVFTFLPVESGLATARRLHIIGSYWSFILISLHLGLHWSAVTGGIRKCTKLTTVSKPVKWSLFAAGLLIAVYGISVFIRRDFLTYMLLRSEFVFLDYEEPVLLFMLDYIALSGACIFVSHYISRLFRSGSRKEKNK